MTCLWMFALLSQYENKPSLLPRTLCHSVLTELSLRNFDDVLVPWGLAIAITCHSSPTVSVPSPRHISVHQVLVTDQKEDIC